MSTSQISITLYGYIKVNSTELKEFKAQGIEQLS